MFINTPSVYKQNSPNPFPKFPISKRPQPRWLRTIWEIGKWELARGTDFPISQKTPVHLAQHQAKDIDFPISQKIPAHMAQNYLGHWEIGKWLEARGTDFPISQKTPAQMGQNDLGKLGNWEMVTSRFPNFPKDPSPDGPARFGNLGNGWRYIFPNFPISKKKTQPRWPSTIWEIWNFEPLTLNSRSLNP